MCITEHSDEINEWLSNIPSCLIKIRALKIKSIEIKISGKYFDIIS